MWKQFTKERYKRVQRVGDMLVIISAEICDPNPSQRERERFQQIAHGWVQKNYGRGYNNALREAVKVLDDVYSDYHGYCVQKAAVLAEYRKRL